MLELAAGVESRASAELVLDGIIVEAGKRIILTQLWSLIGDDLDMKERVLQKILDERDQEHQELVLEKRKMRKEAAEDRWRTRRTCLGLIRTILEKAMCRSNTEDILNVQVQVADAGVGIVEENVG